MEGIYSRLMRTSNRHILLFLLMSFGMAWALTAGLWVLTREQANPIMTAVLFQGFGILMMWTPALAVGILKLTDRGKPIMAASFSPRLRTQWRAYGLAWLAPLLGVIAGGVLYYGCYPGELDLHFGALTEAAAKAGQPLDPALLPIIVSVQVATALTIAPLINTLAALGEEIGWRGFLFPALRERQSLKRTHVLMGVIWSVWHLPINTLGHNYGTTYVTYPWGGIVAMFVFCFGAGIFLSYVTVRSGSIWPAALGHGTINAVGGLPLLVSASQAPGLLGPGFSGILVALPLVVAGIVLAFVGHWSPVVPTPSPSWQPDQE